MAVVTEIRRCNMGCRLTWRCGAIMTAHTRTSYSDMINIHIGPVSRYVAVVAGVGRRDMGRRLTWRRSAVMTAEAGAGNR